MMMAAGGLLGACSEEIDEVQVKEPMPIRLSVAVSEPGTTLDVQGATRAGTSVQTTELASGEAVDVYIKNATSGAFIHNPLACTVSGSSGDLTSATTVFFPFDGSSVDMYAVHPSVASGSAFSVNSDQTTDANYRASDLTYSPTATYAYSSSTQVLPMTHLMAKVIVNIVLPTATPAWTLTDLKVHAKRAVVMTYPTGSSDDYSLGALSDEGTISLNNEGAVLIPPQTITSGTAFITFNIPGVGPYTYKLPADKTFESGKQYSYTITPKSSSISYTTTDIYRVLQSGKFTNSLTNTGSGQVIYTSSNTTVATVNSTTGEVTPVAVGSATITATIPSGYNNIYTTKTASYSLVVGDKRQNPLWYVTENNVKSFNTSTKKVTFETNPASAGSSYCYYWPNAMSYFGKQTTSYDTYWAGTVTDVSNSGFKYHLPCNKEWLSMIPVYTGNVFAKMASGGLVSSATTCSFGYNTTTKNGVSDWSFWNAYVNTSYVRYAIRYLGTSYCSVWKYQMSGTVATITAKLIKPISTSEVSEAKLNEYINKGDSWWNSNTENEGAIQRKFYAVGYASGIGTGNGTANYNTNVCGYYLSTTESSAETERACHFYCSSTMISVAASYKANNGYSVRLFRSE